MSATPYTVNCRMTFLCNFYRPSDIIPFIGILAAQNMNFTEVAPVTHPEEMSLGRGQFAKEGRPGGL